MCVATEIIVLFFIISFLVYTMPIVLVHFSKTSKGKFLLLMLTVVITLYNRTGGLLMAMLIIFLSEFNYEIYNNELLNHQIYEGFAPSMDVTDLESSSTYPSVYKMKKIDQLTVDEYLKSKPA
jgi:hypothetical protein